MILFQLLFNIHFSSLQISQDQIQQDNIKYLESKVNSIPNFPKPGIIFKDLNTIYADPKALNILTNELIKKCQNKYDFIVCLEARGFIGGSILAQQSNSGILLIRKPNKLPGQDIVTVTFDLEYKQGETFCIQKNLVDPTKKYLIFDDIIATGGSAVAAIKLLEKCGVPLENIDLLFIAEIIGLGGKETVGKYKSFDTLLTFRDD